MAELAKAFDSILPKISVTGQSGSTAQYASKGGKKAAKKGAKKSAKKGAKKSAKKSTKKRASRKWFPFLGF
jgi:adenylate kinase